MVPRRTMSRTYGLTPWVSTLNEPGTLGSFVNVYSHSRRSGVANLGRDSGAILRQGGASNPALRLSSCYPYRWSVHSRMPASLVDPDDDVEAE